jgi:hypothetical protein
MGVLKVKKGLDEHIQLVLSRATPLSPHVEEFLQLLVCAHVCHGYGMNLPCFIFYYFCFSIVLGGSGSFCLTLLIQLSIEKIRYHLCC